MNRAKPALSHHLLFADFSIQAKHISIVGNHQELRGQPHPAVSGCVNDHSPLRKPGEILGWQRLIRTSQVCRTPPYHSVGRRQTSDSLARISGGLPVWRQHNTEGPTMQRLFLPAVAICSHIRSCHLATDGDGCPQACDTPLVCACRAASQPLICASARSICSMELAYESRI